MKGKRYTILLVLAAVLVLVLGGCTESRDIDAACLESVSGDYSVVEQDNGNDADFVGGWWVLSIGEFDETGPYFTIYDSVGNPGVEGPILTLDENEIAVDCTEIQDELPSSHWSLEGNTLIVRYEVSDQGIQLTNGDFPIFFTRSVDDELAE